jgi:hypothetical protein
MIFICHLKKELIQDLSLKPSHHQEVIKALVNVSQNVAYLRASESWDIC